MVTERKVITLENKLVERKIVMKFKKAEKKDLFLIPPTNIYSNIKYDKDQERVFGIRDGQEAVYALFLTNHTYETGSDCDWDGNIRSSYKTEKVDSIGVLDSGLNLIAWKQYFDEVIANFSKFYWSVAYVYDKEEIEIQLAQEEAKENEEGEALKRSKAFIDRLGRRK